MNEPYDPDRRISLSEERLRAALAEMELRLRIYFDEQLKHKADMSAFLETARRLDALDRGEWSDVHRRALIDLIDQQGVAEEDKAWTGRQRVFGLVAILVACLSFAFTVYVATASAEPSSPEPIVSTVTE